MTLGTSGKRARDETVAGHNNTHVHTQSTGKSICLRTWDIKYLSHDGSLLLVGPFWTQETCRRCIEICEHNGVWSNDAGSTYPYATCDVEVDQVAVLRDWLVASGFVEDLQRLYWKAHRTRITAFDDLFLVRYQATNGVGFAVVCCSSLLCCAVWSSVVRCGVVWCSVVWCG
eukprot:CAMPEP_0179467840 /NCGR_PEP_ID=MMETSP0799-20121207/48881_1 /TAXON_ID=46947 /ORGANISM="Geminigera cryophila, Strain CCMP2564" /LENGTH=171 /DNA_ID=CAMNT_0021273475 /DNA_START=27 /DNA_END=539 /DNA_ORIENTATION=-